MLTWKDEHQGVSAFTEKKLPPGHLLIDELEGKTTIPWDFALKKVTERQNGLEISDDLSGLSEVWSDYPTNSLAWPLMSGQLKAVIEQNLSGEEGVDWLETTVTSGIDIRAYYIPRFNRKLDVLDAEHSRYIPGTDQIMRSCFSLSKVSNYAMFHDELAYDLWKITPFIYVSEALKKNLQREKLLGLQFEKALVF